MTTPPTEPTHVTIDVFATFPIGTDGRDEISINLSEIASYRGHTVVSYSYEDWTLVVLKNGTTHDVRVSKRDFEARIAKAQQAAAGVLS